MPFVPYWLWNSLKSGSFSYFCRVNPGIRFGGFLDYSKYEILKQIPLEFIPRTEFISDKNHFFPLPEFPFVVKPDLGERGVNVEIIRNKKDWEKYPLEKDLIVQKFIDLPLEFGIFYAKLPKENHGEILSITGKKFLEFEGNGVLNLKKFIESNIRAKSRKDYLLKKYEDQLDLVLPKGMKLLLEPVGNHNRGTMFYDASDLISEELRHQINEISGKINDFFFGRFDVKAQSEEELKNGNFIILEVNGANSEATHIYDPEYNLLQAYKEVKRHLDIQYLIAKKNPKKYSSKEFYHAIFKRL